MDSSLAVWLLLCLSLITANLPWFSDRFMSFKVLAKDKGFLLRLLEWFVYYLIMGAVALGLETKLNGSRHEQGWEFYVVTLCLFMVFALPGIIYHIDLKHHLKFNNQ